MPPRQAELLRALGVEKPSCSRLATSLFPSSSPSTSPARPLRSLSGSTAASCKLNTEAEGASGIGLSMPSALSSGLAGDDPLRAEFDGDDFSIPLASLPSAHQASTAASAANGNGGNGALRASPARTLPSTCALHGGEALVLVPFPAKHLARAGIGGIFHNTPLHAGMLFMTNLRLIWEVSQTCDEIASPICVPIYSIDRMRKQKLIGGASTADSELLLDVYQKYGARASLSLRVSDERASSLVSAVRTFLDAPTQPEQLRANVLKSYAVAHGTALAALGKQASPPPAVFDPEREFQRQGLYNPLSHWRVTRLNDKYELCGTYPRLLVVPRSISDDDVARAAAFRSGRRVPVLCWKDAFGVACICRSSQPMVGFKSRCAQDEKLLQAIGDTNPLEAQLAIIDCRPRVNAELNRAKGKGYEQAAEYVNTRLSFMNIENIHVMRASLRAFLQLLGARSADVKDMSSFYTELDKCGWLEHVRVVLSTAEHVTRLIVEKRTSVLVHCSDGWDRTPQVTALAQLLLDSSFRTRQGFQLLLHKEWLAFGHQFALRCGTIAPLDRSKHGAPSDHDQSPVFLQFVDCVWQLTEQFPREFEFNATYLATLLHLVLSCEHGTFLCNSESQRDRFGLNHRSTSVWDALLAPRCLNYNYVDNPQVLSPDLSASAIKPWYGYYCRGAAALKPEPLSLAEAKCAELASELEQLRAQMKGPALADALAAPAPTGALAALAPAAAGAMVVTSTSAPPEIGAAAASALGSITDSMVHTTAAAPAIPQPAAVAPAPPADEAAGVDLLAALSESSSRATPSDEEDAAAATILLSAAPRAVPTALTPAVPVEAEESVEEMISFTSGADAPVTAEEAIV
eukprot:CAMPEP_0119368348 /NCGR_PEP_ID=MMETSP1334-20130426/15011_1 /TAXON_ID=127549 /ORGANISM="Calcidiscus leptoporus, Strain RCC1130" /LENGTH=857 /DNA_ID=CAMNT_0007384965 /DNA_START=102 /DNA_END=2675 /DNA_ORIENTATION=-